MSSGIGSSATRAIDSVPDDEPDQMTATQLEANTCAITRAQTADQMHPTTNVEQLLDASVHQIWGSPRLANSKTNNLTLVPRNQQSYQQDIFTNGHQDPGSPRSGITSTPRRLLNSFSQEGTSRPLWNAASDLSERVLYSETPSVAPFAVSRKQDAAVAPHVALDVSAQDRENVEKNPFSYHARRLLSNRASESLQTRLAIALQNRSIAYQKMGKRAQIPMYTGPPKTRNEVQRRRSQHHVKPTVPPKARHEVRVRRSQYHVKPQPDVKIITGHKSLGIWKEKSAEKFNIRPELHLVNAAAALYDKRNIQTVVPNRYFKRFSKSVSLYGLRFFEPSHPATRRGIVW